MKDNTKFIKMKVALSLISKKSNSLKHYFNYEVSYEKKDGWFEVVNKSELAEFFAYNLEWYDHEVYSNKLLDEGIALNQPFSVRFTAI